jgi:osmotically-inducible protein OsmY
MQPNSLAQRIQERIHRELHLPVVAAEQQGSIYLSGQASSQAARENAERIAASLAPDKRIVNGIEIESTASSDINDLRGQAEEQRNPTQLDEQLSPTTILTDTGVASSVLDQPLETDEANVSNDSVADLLPSVEPDSTYFAPTDPVTGPDEHGNLDIIGGWTPTSDSDLSVNPSYEDNLPGDEALAEAIERELHEDALTTDLELDVSVENGVARLRGQVRGPEDADAAQDVASRIPGVRDVVDETDWPSL